MATKVRVGVVGCGNISPRYLANMRDVFEILEVVSCCDLFPERSRTREEEFPGVRACGIEDILRDDDIDIVLNITWPKAHAAVGIAALKAGKHVYHEKPIAITREDAKRLLQTAKARKLRVGCAPDTFLGGGLQTCRKLIDDGWIGEPLGATAFMMGRGPEGWHPEPHSFYQFGAGPMLDMGPYYITTLVTLLGPVKRVTGSARISFKERFIGSQPHYGEMIKVEVPTFIAGTMDFAGGAVGNMVMSFDVWKSQAPRIEIYGSDGALSVPDPNTFGGPVKVFRPGAADWQEVPLTHGYSDNYRGLGIADMAYAIRSGRRHRASGELAYHVLDVMHAFGDASESGRHVTIKSACERPAPLPLGLRKGVLDE